MSWIGFALVAPNLPHPDYFHHVALYELHGKRGLLRAGTRTGRLGCPRPEPPLHPTWMDGTQVGDPKAHPTPGRVRRTTRSDRHGMQTSFSSPRSLHLTREGRLQHEHRGGEGRKVQSCWHRPCCSQLLVRATTVLPGRSNGGKREDPHTYLSPPFSLIEITAQTPIRTGGAHTRVCFTRSLGLQKDPAQPDSS